MPEPTPPSRRLAPNRLFRAEALYMLLLPIAIVAIACIAGVLVQLLMRRG